MIEIKNNSCPFIVYDGADTDIFNLEEATWFHIKLQSSTAFIGAEADKDEQIILDVCSTNLVICHFYSKKLTGLIRKL